MIKEIEHAYKDQDRWNDAYGHSNLINLQENPERFIVDPTGLSKQKLDLVGAMSSIEGKRILELGSGRGEFSIALAKLGGTVTGIDIGSALVELSKHAASINHVHCDFVVGTVDKLQFGSNTFDFVVGRAILHHLPKQGVKDSLGEAYRVLKPGGQALFIEPIENSRMFDFIQNLFPVGQRGTPHYRPSILQKSEWGKFLREADDRALSNEELIGAKGHFREIEFRYYGLLIRLVRVFPSAKFRELLTRIDLSLTSESSPVKKLSQSVVVIYRK